MFRVSVSALVLLLGGEKEQERWRLALDLAKEGKVDEIEPQTQPVSACEDD